MPSPLTLILPFYRQQRMLAYQLRELNQYPPEVQVIVVDDGSPIDESAKPVIRQYATPTLLSHLQLYRITVDVAWNREQARNLGAYVAETDWLIQVDLDHLLPAACLPALFAFTPEPRRWYRFPRFRLGGADETRRKDALAPDCAFGPVKPHVDSYLVRKAVYWDAGGYDEPTFAGMLGGGGEFLARLERTAGAPLLLPPEVCLHVVTRSIVPDASDLHCSRDTAPGKVRWREKAAQGLPKPTTWLLQPYERVF